MNGVCCNIFHYSDVIMGAIASQITDVSIVYSTVCSGANQRKHQSTVSLAFVRGIHRWPVNSPHKGPVTRKMSPFHDVTCGSRKLAVSIKVVLFVGFVLVWPVWLGHLQWVPLTKGQYIKWNVGVLLLFTSCEPAVEQTAKLPMIRDATIHQVDKGYISVGTFISRW